MADLKSASPRCQASPARAARLYRLGQGGVRRRRPRRERSPRPPPTVPGRRWRSPRGPASSRWRHVVTRHLGPSRGGSGATRPRAPAPAAARRQGRRPQERCDRRTAAGAPAPGIHRRELIAASPSRPGLPERVPVPGPTPVFADGTRFRRMVQGAGRPDVLRPRAAVAGGTATAARLRLCRRGEARGSARGGRRAAPAWRGPGRRREAARDRIAAPTSWEKYGRRR